MLADLITFSALFIIFIGAVIHDAFCEENEQYILPILKDIKNDTLYR